MPFEASLAHPESTNRLRFFVELAKNVYPTLEDVRLRTYLPSEEEGAGGWYDFEEGPFGEPIPVIFLAEGDTSTFAKLFVTRRASVELAAHALNIEPSYLSPNLLRLFIAAHELGHIQDFKINYQEGKYPTWEAIQTMDDDRVAALASLPVPDLNPSKLAMILKGVRSIEEAVFLVPSIRSHPDFFTVRSVEDILRLQEREYRASPMETYADAFAATCLRNHARALGITDLLHT